MSLPERVERVLEAAIEAERAALGAVLVDGRRYDDVAAVVGSDWYRHAHGLIWAAIGRVVAAGDPVDLLTVKAALGADLAEVGGAGYVAGLLDGVPRSANAEHYARQVREHAERRALATIGQALADEARAGDGTAAEALGAAEAALAALRTGQPGTDVIDPAAQVDRVTEAIEAAREGRARGVPTGLRDLDVMLSGWRAGQLIVLGARPSQGKTALALNLAIAAGARGAVLFVSCEMSATQIGMREVSVRSGIDHGRLDHGQLGARDYARVQVAAEAMRSGGVHVLDAPGATVAQIRGAVRRLARRGPVALAVVDYLQLLRSERGERAENRTQEVAGFSAGLKRIARECEVPVLALSQLSRESEKRQDKRPFLADLRESGSLEQDADVVLLLHRPGVYERTPEDGRAEIVVAKQRNGPTGEVFVRFEPSTMTFRDAEPGVYHA